MIPTKMVKSHLRVNNWQDNDREQVLAAQHLVISGDFNDHDYFFNSDNDYNENTKMVKAFFIWG